MARSKHSLAGRIPKRLLLWGGLGAALLGLSSLSAFARDHALMINVSPPAPLIV